MKARKLAQLQPNTSIQVTTEDGTILRGTILENDGESLEVRGQTVFSDGSSSEWAETVLDYEDLKAFFVLTGEAAPAPAPAQNPVPAAPEPAPLTLGERLRQYLKTGEKPAFWQESTFPVMEDGGLSQHLNAVSDKNHRRVMQPVVDKFLYGQQCRENTRMNEAIRQMNQLFRQDEELEDDPEVLLLAAAMLYAAGRDGALLLEQRGFYYEAANCLLQKQPKGYAGRVLTNIVLALLREDDRRAELYSMLFQGILASGDAALLPTIVARFPEDVTYLAELIEYLSQAAGIDRPTGGLKQQAEHLAEQFPAGLPSGGKERQGELFSYDRNTETGAIEWDEVWCTFSINMVSSRALRSYLKSLRTRDLDKNPVRVLLQTHNGVPVALREDPVRETLAPERLRGEIFSLKWTAEEGQIRTEDGETFPFRYASLTTVPLKNRVKKIMMGDLTGKEIQVTFQLEQGWAVGIKDYAVPPKVELSPEARFQRIRASLTNGDDENRFRNALRDLPPLFETPLCGQALELYLSNVVAQYNLDSSREWLTQAAKAYRQYQNRYLTSQQALRTLVTFAGKLGETELILSSVRQLMGTQTIMGAAGTVQNDVAMCAKLCQTQYWKSGDKRLLECCGECLDTMKTCLPRDLWGSFYNYQMFWLVETGELEEAAALQKEAEEKQIALAMDEPVAQKLGAYRAQQQPAPEPEPEPEPVPEDEGTPEETPEPEIEPEPEEEPAPAPRRQHRPLPDLPVRNVKIDLTNGIFKDITCPGGDGDPEAVETVWRLIAGGAAPSALLYARALTRGAPELWQPVYAMLAYAYQDPLLAEEYRYARLQAVYGAEVPGCTVETVERFALCALLRMLFADQIDENILYSVKESLIRDALGDCRLYQEADAFSNLFEELCAFIHDHQQGFGPETVGKIKSFAEVRQQRETAQLRARELLEMRSDVTASRNARVNGVRQKLFGREGSMKKLIRIAAENRVDELEDGLRFCERFRKNQAGAFVMDEKPLNQYIDEIWDSTSELTTSRKTERLIGAQRQNILNKVESYLQAYQQWAELCQVKDTGSNAYVDVRDRLLDLVEQARRQLAARGQETRADENAALTAVAETLADIKAQLQGKKDTRQYFYRDFLTSGHVELDMATMLPMLDESVSILPGYELWNRVLLHERDKIPFAEYQEQVLRGDGAQEYDFGRQMLLIRYLGSMDPLPEGVTLEQLNELEEQISRNVEAMPSEIQRMEQKFNAEMELAEAYGRFADLGAKDRILHEFRDWYRPSADHSCNYGFYSRAMNACCAAVERDSQRLRETYLDKLNQMKADLAALQEEKENNILDAISALIDEGKYSVADDYMRLARSGYTAPPVSYMRSGNSTDYFEQFLDEYNALFQSYGQQAERTLQEVYKDYNRTGQGDAQQDAYALIEAWPGGDRTQDESIAAFLTALGLQKPRQIQRISATGETTDENTLSWHYLPEQSVDNASDYEHPIAAFGSRLSRDGLTIRLILGRTAKDKILSTIRSYGATGGPVVILLDYFLSLPERRAIAATMKQEGASTRTMVLIDRIMAVFLSGIPKDERVKAMLQCTLPFSWLNPYHKSSASVIPPEMFMGRREELRSILEPSGTHIIYGGRQLGKTALLQRARARVDNSALGNWAIYLSIKEKTEAQVLPKIYDELVLTGFLDAGDTVTSWDDLCTVIRVRMQSQEQEVKQVLLLLDEADTFLQSCEKTGYIVIDQLLALQNSTGDKFKFVLAGLHNVLRYSRKAMDNNVSLMRLSPMCIKPLKYSEGSELLEKPLFYLGFRVKPEHTPLISQILSTCNYYPGLIHYYAYQLLNKMELNRTNDTSAPPYYLDETQIRNLLQDPEFNEQIKEKLFITLGVDANEGNHYSILAYALAYCFHTDKAGASFGFTALDLMHICAQFEIWTISDLEEYTVHALLEEMVELNVLQTTDKKQYSFNRRSFLEMLGDEETVMEELYRFADVK
ncbi:MAG: hypothetical protein LUD78_10480 [Clostridiales bacterium]|nr:hypothetical protein [Clostridiales bacterium]